MALQLLQRQSPDILASDWRILLVGKLHPQHGSQDYILLISKAAKDPMFGSVLLRLKKCHPKNANTNTLEADEMKEDLGLEKLTLVAARHVDDPGQPTQITPPDGQPTFI